MRTCSPACGRRSRAIRAWSASSARTTMPSPPRAPWRRSATCSTTSCTSARRATWSRSGPASEPCGERASTRPEDSTPDRYPQPSIEDIELGGRLARQGRILLDPAIQGTHLKEWSLGSMVRTDFGRRGVPWVSLLVSRRELPATLNLGARERASVVAALLVAWGIVRRRPLAVAAGVGRGGRPQPRPAGAPATSASGLAARSPASACTRCTS